MSAHKPASYNTGNANRNGLRQSTFDTPLSWSMAPRTGQTAIELGCAIERRARRPYGAWWWAAMAAISIAGIALVVFTK